MIIGVLVELSNKNIDKIFDYSVPLHMQKYIKVGIRVEVPFGRMSLEGFVLEIKSDTSVGSLKEIISIVDDDVILNDELLLLGKEIQRNTLSTLKGEALYKSRKTIQANIIPRKNPLTGAMMINMSVF